MEVEPSVGMARTGSGCWRLLPLPRQRASRVTRLSSGKPEVRRTRAAHWPRWHLEGSSHTLAAVGPFFFFFSWFLFLEGPSAGQEVSQPYCAVLCGHAAAVCGGQCNPPPKNEHLRPWGGMGSRCLRSAAPPCQILPGSAGESDDWRLVTFGRK